MTDQVVKDQVYATLPNDPQTCLEAINRGVPLSKVASTSKLQSGIKDLAHKLHQQFQVQGDSIGNGARLRKRFWIF